MASRKSTPTKQSTLDSPDKQPKPTKETLLKALENVESEMKKIHHGPLGERLKELRGHVKHVLENQEEEIKNLRDEILKLKKEVERQKAKNEKLEKALVLAQATWEWEKHLARFVVDSSKKIYRSGWNDQMEYYLGKTKTKDNRFDRIQDKLTRWTSQHWRVVGNVRRERNGMAHPDLIDLDLVESELEEMSPADRKLLEDMLDELKMTASLMKFGRLANHMFQTEGARCKKVNARALKEIISWDCEFEDIDGLQNVEHEEAKEYLTKYVDDRNIDRYISIVDFIRDANSERLGKLAWEIESKLSTEYGEALSHLKKLLPNPDHKSKFPKYLDVTIAKLHVPDFLPKHLWKHGNEIVDLYDPNTV